MKFTIRDLLWLTVVVAVFQLLPAIACAQDDDIAGRVKRAIAREEHDELDILFREAFKSATPGKISFWMTNQESDSLALRAAWERVRPTLTESQDDPAAKTAKVAIHRFLGFVEGRLRVEVPAFWQAALEVIEARDDGGHAIPYPETEPELDISGSDSGLLGKSVLVTKGVVVADDGSKLVIARGAASCTVPKELVDKAQSRGIINGIDARFDQDHCYFTIRTGDPNPYLLAAVNTKTGRLKWTTTVWAAGGDLIYLGRNHHLTTLTLKDETLYIFGVSSDCAYIEAFATRDGAAKLRFATSRYTVLP
jgi:hypothetical protein